MLTTLGYATVGLALVLILRLPTRRLFGASAAFTLWLLPPWLVLLPCLPAAPARWLDLPPLQVLPATRFFVAKITPSASSTHWIFLLWAIGCLLCLSRLAIHYRQLRSQSRPLPIAMWRVLQSDWADLDPRRLRLHPAGPALLWAPRSLILLPADFLKRFEAHQRHLVLQHEHAHLRRGDALWSLLGELMLALLWFHPLAWLARPRLRLDQELACDEHVLRQSPQEESSYAHTLLHSTGVAAMPMFIPWLTQPQLKERLNMIQRPRPGTLRRRVGFIALAMLMSSAAFVAPAAAGNGQHATAKPSQEMSYVTQSAPIYPADAIKKKEQGTVVLLVLVSPEGKPIEAKAEATTQAAPDLIKAATDAVMTWHFNPTMKNGKPIAAYARVPITFSLDQQMPPAPPAPTGSSAPTSPSI
jgi:TonB family protein